MVWVCSAAFLLLLVLGSKNRLELRAMAAGPELALRLRLELLDGWIRLPIVWTLRLEGDGHRARLYVLGKERSFPRGKRGAKPWMKRFGRQLLRRCRVRELSCCLLLGFAGEAALTAKACGAFLLAGSTLGALLRAKNPSLHPRVLVTPNFRGSAFSLQLSCMIAVSTGHSMVAAFHAIFRKRKGAKA